MLRRSTFSSDSKLFVESRQFLYLAPPLRVTPFEFCRDLRKQKTTIPIVWRCLCDLTFSRFSRTPTCVRQPHDYHMYRASMASRGKNGTLLFSLLDVYEYKKQGSKIYK